MQTKTVLKTISLTLLTTTMFAATTLPIQAATVADQGNTTATVTFTQGSLELLAVPNLDFGQHQIQTGTNVIPGIGDVSMKISDARGTGAGWELSVALSTFMLEGSPTLEGAKIQVTSPTASPADGTINQNPPAAPVDGSDNLTIISGGGEVKILAAQQNKGLGSWQATWDASNTRLIALPGTASADIGGQPSTATMEWTLKDAP